MADLAASSYWFVDRMRFHRDEWYPVGKWRLKPQFSDSSGTLIHELDFSTLLFSEEVSGGWDDDDGDDGAMREFMLCEGIGPAAIIGVACSQPDRNALPAENPHPVTQHRYNYDLLCLGCGRGYYTDNLRDQPCTVPGLTALEQRDRRYRATLVREREEMYGPK